MPAAIAVPLIVGGATAGATLYGAHQASKAAKDAAQTQTDYGNRALDLQQQMYQQDRADQAPYRNIGYGALNTLGSMMGPKFNAGGGGFQPSMGGQPTAGPSAQPPMGQGFNLGAMSTAGSVQSPMAGQGDTVLMLGPDGSQKRVPRGAVSHFEARGAQVIG